MKVKFYKIFFWPPKNHQRREPMKKTSKYEEYKAKEKVRKKNQLLLVELQFFNSPIIYHHWQ